MPSSLRISDYTIYVKIPKTGEFVLVHGYTGAIDVVQSNVVEFFKSYGKASQKVGISEKTVEVLKQRGYLTEKTHEEEQSRVADLSALLHKMELV